MKEILNKMTVEEKVGQLFLAHCPYEGAEELVERLHLGGLLMFARNFENRTPEQFRDEVEKYNKAAKIPLLIAADEEGGTVVRISKFPQYRSEPFCSPKEIFARGGYEAVREEATEKADLLLSLGVNYDLAPVCDYTVDESKYIAKRVFGRSPEESSEFIKTTVTAFLDKGLCCSLKHFPGYGGNADTHKGMATDNRPLEIFETEDLLPFTAGIEAGAQSVMVSHNIVTCFDPDYPASLSEKIHKYLREKLGFEGVIITDSLTMLAIRQFTEDKDPCVRALMCGNDMIITSFFEQGYASILEAVKDGTVPMKRLDEAVGKILKMKMSIGIDIL